MQTAASRLTFPLWAQGRIDHAPAYYGNSKGEGDHQAWDDAGQKQLSNRGFRKNSIDDQDYARRYKDPRVPTVATVPQESLLSYPYRSISGTAMVAKVAAVAGEEPQMTLNP